MDIADRAYVFEMGYLQDCLSAVQEICGEPIPEARRIAVPGVRLCVECQQDVER
jgi:hypothetical protein